MLRLVALLAGLFAIASCMPEHPLVRDEAANNFDVKEAAEILKRVLRGSNENTVEVHEGRVGFSWDNCGSKSDAIQVKSLAVSPDPITIPGTVNASADVAISEDIVSPSSVELVVEKKLFGVFIKVPCVDNLGSCTYENPCNLLANITCPEIFKQHGINCRCPIKKNEYKLPPTAITLPDIKLPSFIENGDYKVKATLMKGSTRLGCYEITASLKTKSQINV